MENTHRTGRSATLLSAVVVVLALFAAAFSALRALEPPSPKPAGAPEAEFSAERAYRLLAEIGAEPHPLGTPAHDEVRDVILRMWRDLGYEPQVQSGFYLKPDHHYAARVENILVRLPGTKPGPNGALMMAAHYDSVEPAPGAADDGSAVVTLLETARALKAGPRLAEDVIFLITDAEEDGLIGAHVFRDEHPWAKEVGLALNFEARGTAGPSLMFETSVGNERLIAALAGVPHPRAFSFSSTVYRRFMPNSSDLGVWMRGGMQGMNFAFVNRPYDYHTAGDNLANLDLRSLQHQGSYALSLARRFGNEGVPPRSRRDAVHFSLFGDVFIRYSPTAALLLVGLIGALLFAAARLGSADGRLGASGIVRGFLFAATATAASAVLGYGFLALIAIAHRSWLPAGPWIYSGGYFLALLFLVTLATTLLYGIWKARRPAFATAFGAALFWAGLSAAVTVMAPDASYLVSGPALFVALGLLGWSWRTKRREDKDAPPPVWIAASAAVGVVLIAAPFLFLLFVAMFLSPVMAAVQAFLIAAVLAALTPALEVMRRGLGRAFPALCVALFLGFVIFSALSVRYSERIPRAATFDYINDFDKGEAFWVSKTPKPDAWTESVAGGPLAIGHPRAEYVLYPERHAFRAAPLSMEPPPEVRLVEDRSVGDARFLRLRIVSPRGGRRITLSCTTGHLRAAALEGRPLVLIPQNVKGFAAAVLNPGPEGVEVSLELAAGTSVRLTVEESNPGFPDIPGFEPPPSPPGIRPHRIHTLLTKSFDFPPPNTADGY